MTGRTEATVRAPRPARFGVAGTAYWAREVHIPGLMTRPDVELVGVWGRDGDAARSIAGSRNLRAFRSFDEMLAHVDAVTFAVAPQAQPALATSAARAGKHLLLEKPIALSSANAVPLVDAISSRGLASIVFFMRRFVPSIESAIQIGATECWHRASVCVHSAALTSATPFANSPWRHEAGAELWDIGPHVLSILRPMLGPVIRVDACRRTGPSTALATSHASGANADISLTLRASPDDARIEYRFHGRDGAFTLPEPPIDRPAALANAAGALVNAIHDPKDANPLDAAFGLEVVRVLEAAERSMASGKPADLAPQ